MKKRILIACEFSDTVGSAFRAAMPDAYVLTCDLLPSEGPGPHLRGDVRNILHQEWDMIIAFPPCTYLSNAGLRWLYAGDSDSRWDEMHKAINFFRNISDHPCPKICIENPVHHKWARRQIRKYDQLVRPWQFGHPEKKPICLWLKGLPPLKPTSDSREGIKSLPKKTTHRVLWMSPGKSRQKERSRFYPGIAAAMAEQWGKYV